MEKIVIPTVVFAVLGLVVYFGLLFFGLQTDSAFFFALCTVLVSSLFCDAFFYNLDLISIVTTMLVTAVAGSAIGITIATDSDVILGIIMASIIFAVIVELVHNEMRMTLWRVVLVYGSVLLVCAFSAYYLHT